MSGAVSHAAAENATQPIWLIGMLSMTGTTFAGKGISYQIGGELMLEVVNRNPALLPGYELKVVWQDDHCDPGVGSMHILDNIFEKRYEAFAPDTALSDMDISGDGRITMEDVESASQIWNASRVSPDPVGLIGPSCSNVAITVANIAYKGRLPLISPTATRPILSDRSLYPNFFRTQSPDIAYNKPFIAVARLLQQTSIVVVIAEAANWHSGATDLAQAAAEQGVELAGPNLDHEIPGFNGLQITMDSAAAARGIATELLRLKRRIVIILTYDTRARLVLCESYRVGFHNAVYMVMGWFVSSWWRTPDTACTVDQLDQMAMNQVVPNMMQFRTDAATQLSCSSGMSSGQFKTELYARQVNASRHGYIATDDAAFVADAICMYALMLHEVLVVQGLPLPEMSARTSRAYSLVQSVLSHTDFEGVSGPKQFVPGQADPKASVIVRQVQPGGMVDIALYTHPRFNFLGRANLTFQFPGESFFAGPAGAETIPAHLTPFVTCPNGKLPDLGTNTCKDCPQHMEFVQAAETCLCTEGYHAAPNGGCLPCAEGSYSNTAGTLECTLCEAGKYSTRGATSCLFCPRGSYTESIGTPTCARCPHLQTTQEIGAADRTKCVCDRGGYRAPGSASGAECRACPANANTSGIASTDVSECKCAQGMYMSATGACVACPVGSTTTESGKTSILACLCQEGEYMPADAPGCRACPSTMRCPRGSNEANFVHLGLAQLTDEQRFPELRPRYWSSAEEPMSVFDCRDEKKCPGGIPGSACAPKMTTSVACQRCDTNYHWDGNNCVECKALQALGYVMAVLFLLGAPVLVVLIYRFSGDTVNSWGTRGNAIAGLGFVSLNQYQMLALVSTGALLPLEFKWSTDAITWTLDWYRIFQPDCTGVADLTAKMVLKAVSPVVALFVCLCTYVLSAVAAHFSKRPELEMARSRLFNIFGGLCFTFFGAISLMSMSLFECSNNPNGRHTLSWDMSVICFSSGQWRSMLGVAIFCVLLYVVGLGSVFVRIIAIAPAHFQDEDFRARWKFLFIRFHSGAYWWGVIHLGKNFLIQLAFVIFSAGWRGLCAAMAGLIIYSGIAMLVMPYRTIVVNAVEMLSGACVLYITSMLLLFADRAEDQGDREIMVTVVFFGALPLLFTLSGMAFVQFRGKRRSPTSAQVDSAERDFEDLSACAKALAEMDVKTGGELLLWLGEWERRSCLQSAKILRSDLLGMTGIGRLSHKDVPKRVTTCIKASTSTLRYSLTGGSNQGGTAAEGIMFSDEEGEAAEDLRSMTPEEDKSAKGGEQGTSDNATMQESLDVESFMI